MRDGRWPALPLAQWRDSYATLHLWTQVIGKLTLATTPLVNHFWNVALHFTSRGLATPAMDCGGGGTLTVAFDFVDHRLELHSSTGCSETLRLEPMTVAAFHAAVAAALGRMGIAIPIWTVPVEIENPVRFEEDTRHRSYDRACVNAFWRALDSMRPVFESFRGEFIGKCSPLHFFWGSFDLAVTRFSGNRAPQAPDADAITREAYSHEVISHGFWPGGGGIEEAAFYAYAVPQPQGFAAQHVLPMAAFYSEGLKEFLLPYEAVRTSASPESALRDFLHSTYDAGANLAGWRRQELERGAR